MNIIIMDEHASSRINGIGTYIRILIYILKKLEANIYLIAYSHDCKRFTMKEENGICTFYFPPLPLTHYYMVIDKFLGLYLNDSKRNLFLFNYTPCELFLRTIKKRFPLSKLAFTIHDMTWTYELFGDTEKLKHITPAILLNEEEKKYESLGKNLREEQRMYKIVDKVITLAQETYDLLINQYKVNPAKISFIPNGVDDVYTPISDDEKRLIRSAMYLDKNEKIILYAGRIHYIKGIFSLIKSFENIIKQYPNCRLVLAGFVLDFPRISSFSKNIASKITFTGQLTKEELKSWYQIADIGVLPSYVEQCSYTGIEMMMHQLPVVASDGFCVSDMFKDGENAKIAKIGDREKKEEFEDNLYRVMLDLLQSETLCQKLAKNGRMAYESIYRIDHMLNRYRMLLDELFN